MNRKDLRYLSWSLSRASSGTAGSFLKSYEVTQGVKYYYKVSNFDTIRGVYGHECVNEIVAQNVADILGIPHLRYELLYADIQIDGKGYVTWLTVSQDFKREGEHKLTFETYYEMARQGQETVWDFILRQGMTVYFYELFLLDYIICNRDRHGANIEVLERDGQYRLAPVFDNGLSFLFSCYGDGEAMGQADLMKDGPVNNYVGSKSLTENLKKVPLERLRKVRAAEFTPETVFAGLQGCEDAVPADYWKVVLKMIRERVGYVEKICN